LPENRDIHIVSYIIRITGESKRNWLTQVHLENGC